MHKSGQPWVGSSNSSGQQVVCLGSKIRVFQQVVEMATTDLRFENMVDGVSNYSPWKKRIMLVLMENGIWEFTNTQITPPTNLAQLVIHN
jgi:hypothetical protein